MKIVVYGLTITSSWGNGHATTYRSLCKALAAQGHQIIFVEKDVEWYRSNRDLPHPPYCSLRLYQHWSTEAASLIQLAADADAVVIGSYFPDAISAAERLLQASTRPLLFYDIDTPITLARLQSGGRTEYLNAALIPHFDAYLSFTGGPALTTLQQVYGSPHAVAFYCSVDPEVYRPVRAQPQFQCDLSYLGTYARDRQSKLERLLGRPAEMLPSCRFLVAGPQYPPDIRWGPNVQRIVHLAPPEHPSFYSSSRFTLNLTRDDMVQAGYSPSVRLFEASACGAAILSDPWPGLDDFLSPGREILVPTDEYEVEDMLRNLSDQERTRMGALARERILASHTSAHRARQFEAIVASVSVSTPQHLAEEFTIKPS